VKHGKSEGFSRKVQRPSPCRLQHLPSPPLVVAAWSSSRTQLQYLCSVKARCVFRSIACVHWSSKGKADSTTKKTKERHGGRAEARATAIWARERSGGRADSRPPRPPCRPAPRCTGGRRRPCRAAREEGGGLRRAAREEGGICAASRQRRAAGCEASIRRY